MRRLFTFAFTIAFFLFVASAPALAAPYMSWGQWTSGPGDGFSRCWSRAGAALQSVGLTPVQDGRFFHGSNDVFMVSVVCYDLGNRFIVNITVAAERSGVSDMTTDQVRDRINAYIFGTSTGSCNSVVGTWHWWNDTTVVFSADGTLHNDTGLTGTWRHDNGHIYASWSNGAQGDYLLGADAKTMTEMYNGDTKTMRHDC